MNKIRAALYASPATLTTLWAYFIWLTERKKKQVNDQKYYEELKTEVVQTYKNSIDQSNQQPLIHLLQTKRYELDPELRKRLEILEEWKRDNMWTFSYKLGAAYLPSILGMSLFPRSTTFIMCGFAVLIHINYLNERQILSGGKQKSYFIKNVIPKQDTLMKGLQYATLGIMSLSLFKMGVIKYTTTGKQKVISAWKKRNQIK